MATPTEIKRRGRLSLILGAVVAAMALGAVAWADNVQVNGIEVDGVTAVRTLEVTTGTGTVDSANFNYRIQATGAGNDGQAGCNASDLTSATLSVNGLPTGVSAVADTSLVFTVCGPAGAKGLHLSVGSATVAGDYAITVSVSDAGTGTYTTDQASFTLRIIDGTAPNISYAITDGASGSPTVGDNGWYTSNVHVDWTVSEPNSPSSVTIPSGKCVDTLINTDTTGTTLECSASSDGGSAANQSATIKRDATAPSVAISSPADGASVSSATVNVSGTASDATSDIASVKVNGSSATYDSTTDTWSITDVALSCGANTITAEAKDNAGHASQDSHSVTRICNQPPVVDAAITGDTSADEGTQKTYSIGATDPDGDTITYAWSITAGSAFASISGAANASSVTVSFTDGPSSPDVTLHVVVGDGHAGHDVTRTKTVHVANVAPQVSLTSPAATASEGQTNTYNYTANDPGADTYSIDAGYPTCGTGGMLVPSSDSITGTSGSQTGTFQCSFPDGPANPTVAISITDSDGETGSASQPVAVSNVAPQVSLISPAATASEGQTNTYNYTVNDPGADTYSIDAGYPTCGTGGMLVPSSDSITGTSGSQTGTFQCSFPDGPANPTVAISITDSDGETGSASQPVAVSNVAPTVGTLTLTGNGGTACIGGNTVNLQFSFGDPAVANDTYTGSIDWGDSNSTSFGSSFNVNESHTYSAGTYTIKVNVHDEDPGGAAAEKQASVSLLYNMTGILTPFNPDGSSIFRYGSTIPVKVRITDCSGNSVPGLAPTVGYSLNNAGTPSTDINESVFSTSAADTGNTMRYDATGEQYIYNFNSKSLPDAAATYFMRVSESHSTPSPATMKFGVKTK